MAKLIEFERIPYVTLLAAIHLGMRFHYKGTHYDPADFSYWGA